MSRWKAASLHLSVSVLIGLLTAALIFGVWYPQPYIRAAGADGLILLLLGVDVTLGPLLTLVVFKAGKKGMRFDMAVIVLAQLCAYTYGMSVVVHARPVYVVAAVDRLNVVMASDLDAKDLDEAKDARFRSLPWTGPRVVGVARPTDTEEHNKLLFSGASGRDIENFPKYYVDYEKSVPELLAHAQTIDALKAKHPQTAAPLDAWLRQSGRRADEVAYVPLQARKIFFTALLDHKSGAILDVLPFDPW